MVEIDQVGVDVVFTAVKLKIETALGVGKWSDVENRGFPFEAGAPDDSFEMNIETSSRIGKQLHHGAAIIAITVDGVEQRGVAAEAVGVDCGGGVDGMACIEEYAGAMDGVVLGANVQRRSAGERCVCAVEMETASEFTGRTFQNGAKLVGMVEKQRFEKQIVECSAGVEEDAKTVRETRSARVHLGQQDQRWLVVDERGWTAAGSESVADGGGVVGFESTEEFVVGRHGNFLFAVMRN